MTHTFSLATKFLLRDWRSGELSILAIALIIAVASSTAIGLFADRLNATLLNQAAEFMAADLRLSSHTPLPQTWFEEADKRGLQQAQTIEFSTVVLNGDELLLTSVKAVSSGYPLRGYVRITDGDLAAEVKTGRIPDPGTAWVERRVLTTLNLALGDAIEVGEKRLTVTRLITYEPDRQGSLYNLSPRVMIHTDDLAATKVVQPGSRVHYFALFASEDERWLAFARWLKTRLAAGQSIMDVREGRPEMGTALNRAERYLGLASIVVVVIAGVAIAMAARRYSQRHFDASAILRCLGAGQRQVLLLFLYQLLLVGVLASLVGCLLGWLGQQGLVWLLADLLPERIAQPSGYAFGLGFITGLVILFGFAVAPVMRLQRTSPLRVLRRDLEPVQMSAWLIYGLALLSITLLVWRYTRDAKLMLTVLVFGGVTVAVLGGLIALLLMAIRRWRPQSFVWRLGLQGIQKDPVSSIVQVAAFAITLTAMLVLLLVRTDLLDSWRAQLPRQAPNHFAVNIFSHQLTGFKQWMASENIHASQLYPITRGRLTEINGESVRRIVSKESQGERAINRDLSLTWSEILPAENKIVSGQWWDGAQTPRQVSVEEKLAASMQIQLGDVLTFTIEGRSINATVNSIRNLNWDTMRPNFYMVFSPGSLEGFATTWLTSFYLSKENKHLLRQLIEKFPAVTVLEVDLIIAQIRTIMLQVTAAIEYVLVFALLAGLMVLFAAVRASLDTRIYESVLLRALGANRRLLRESHWIEFAGLGFLAGLLAVLVAEVLIWALYQMVFDLSFQLNVAVCVLTPLFSALIVGLAGYWGTRSVVNQSPMKILTE